MRQNHRIAFTIPQQNVTSAKSVRKYLEKSGCDVIQYVKVVFKSFTAAAWVLNEDAGTSETGQGKAHGHAVIVVSVHPVGSGSAGVNGDAVTFFFTADAHS